MSCGLGVACGWAAWPAELCPGCDPRSGFCGPAGVPHACVVPWRRSCVWPPARLAPCRHLCNAYRAAPLPSALAAGQRVAELWIGRLHAVCAVRPSGARVVQSRGAVVVVVGGGIVRGSRDDTTKLLTIAIVGLVRPRIRAGPTHMVPARALVSWFVCARAVCMVCGCWAAPGRASACAVACGDVLRGHSRGWCWLAEPLSSARAVADEGADARGWRRRAGGVTLGCASWAWCGQWSTGMVGSAGLSMVAPTDGAGGTFCVSGALQCVSHVCWAVCAGV